MEANNIRDIMEAYVSIYTQPEEVGEVLSEEVIEERKIDRDEKLPSGLTPREKMQRKRDQHAARVKLGEPALGRKGRNDPYRDSYGERAHTMDTVKKAQDKGEEPRETSEFKNTIAARRRPRASYEVPNERPGGLRAKETKAGGHRTLKRKSNQNESYDLFDYLLEYLVAEGYADTNKNALVIMANMSEEWRQSIVEEVISEGDIKNIGLVGPQ